ncbi:hypothetical protein ACV07N_04220 [Roseivirga echinicomitans]
MTALEAKAIQLYLADLEVDEVEFYNEMYDHIATAYIERTDRSLRVKEFLKDVITPSFGGEKALRAEIDKQKKIVRKGIYKEALLLYLSFFSTSKGLLKSTLVLCIILVFNELSTNRTLFSALVILAICLPFWIINIIQWRFKSKCRKRKLPFYTSHTNRIVLLITTLLVAILQGLPDITSRILYGERFSLFRVLEANTTIHSISAFLFIIYGWVCLEMIWRKSTINKKITSKFLVQ